MAKGPATLLRRLTAARMRPAEGWAIVVVHALIVVNAALVVGRSDWVSVPASLATVAALGAVVGFGLAKTSCPDIIAHLTAALIGLWVVVFQVLTVFPELGVSRRDRLAALIERARVWYRATTSGNQQDDQILFVLVLAFTLWLVTYLSAWTLFRRRWLLISLLLPGFMVLVMLGYSPELGNRPVVVALLLSGILSARYFAFRRQQVWSRFRIPAPPGLGRRFLTVGSGLVVAILLLAWTLPISSDTAAIDNWRDRVEGPVGSVGDWWLDVVPDLSGKRGPSSGSYASFGESFTLGGALSLSDDPAIVLRGVESPRSLVGLRYGLYTGRGWESDVAETFNPVGPDGTIYSPQLTFRPQQAVTLSDLVRLETSEIDGTVTMVRSKGDVVFSLGAYLRADVPTSVQLSWRRLDDVAFVVGPEDGPSVPTDLLPLSSLLRSTSEYGAGNQDIDGSPLPDDDELAARIQVERQQLAGRFLATRWEIAETGTVTLFVTGQLPVYDDIEAIYARGALPEGASYEVAGLESGASSSDLRRADTEYPEYVVDRYLSLPDTVTQRTRDLAMSLAGERSNPFDIAREIERDIRGRIAYSLDIDPPPSGQDVVDFVLFDSQVGYCEYHSSAMAVLLRTVGIPSRIAVGYHQVGLDAASEAYVYRESDAHAWVEVFFPGYGWIPFEPTPSEPIREYGNAAPSEAPLESQLPTPTVAPERTPDALPAATDDAAATPTPAAPALNVVNDSGPRERGWRDWVPWLVVAAVVAAVGALWFVWSLPLRGLSPGGMLLRQTVRFGGWRGVRGDPTMTPEEYAAELGRAVPGARRPARYVADLYTAERYGGHTLTGPEQRSGQRAMRLIRRSFLRSLVRRHASSGGVERD